MKTHAAPKVFLIARPSIDWVGVDGLLAEYGLPVTDGVPRKGWNRGPDSEGDMLPELMGRLCYGSFGERQGRVGAKAYHANILSSGHGSVLEHACWSFVVCGASRGFTHQMVRHRAGFAFSQESQHFIRYSTEGEPSAPEAAVCLTGIPEELREGFADACGIAVGAYAGLWGAIRERYPEDAKVKKEVSGAARGLLPNALESRLGFTANARALRHFCELRGTPDNVLEIRLVAARVAEIMMEEAPAIFQDFSITADLDGHPTVASNHRKV